MLDRWACSNVVTNALIHVGYWLGSKFSGRGGYIYFKHLLSSEVVNIGSCHLDLPCITRAVSCTDMVNAELLMIPSLKKKKIKLNFVGGFKKTLT